MKRLGKNILWHETTMKIEMEKKTDTAVWSCYFYKRFIMLHTSKHNQRQTEQREVQTKLIVNKTTVNNYVNRHPKIGL